MSAANDGSIPAGAIPIGPNLAKFFYEQDSGWGVISHAFWKGFDVLCNQCPPEQSSNNDLIFPTLFLCRHYFELGLKSLIEGTTHLGKASKQKIPTIHKLPSLVDVLKQRLLPYGTLKFKLTSESQVKYLDVTEELSTLTDLAAKFDKFDPDSMRFRYPTDRNGAVHPYPQLNSLLSIESPSELQNLMSSIRSSIDIIAEIIVGIIDCERSQPNVLNEIVLP